MKAKNFFFSAAFLALIALVSCETIGTKAQAEPNKNAAQTAISAARIAKTLKATNQNLIANNSVWEQSIMGKDDIDAICLEVLASIKTDIMSLHDGLYIAPSQDNSPAFGQWSKNQAELVSKLRSTLKKLQTSKQQGVARLWVSDEVFNNYAEPLMLISDFSAMAVEEQLNYSYILKQDLLQLHNLLLRNILASFNKLELKFDAFEVFANPAQSCINLGDEYQADLMLGAFTRQAKFSISVDGVPLAISDGKANYKIKPKTVGQQFYKVEVSASNPMSGEVVKVNKDFSFNVMPK